MLLDDVTSTPIAKLAPRAATSHKGDYGRVLVIGGSRGMAGAPALAGKAALRSGAGLVTLAVPRSIQATAAGFEPSYMTIGLGEEVDDALQADRSEDIHAAAEKMTAIALGPGLGTALSTSSLVQSLYTTLKLPTIVDADGLNAIAQRPEILKLSAGPRILTPHAGEFQRLSGKACSLETEQRAQQAAELCRCDPRGETIVVLKGHRTIIADGSRFAVNATGNPGMATGGTGDCLTGIIAALVAQGLSPWDAARLGVHAHGLAGDLGAEAVGEVSLVASDLIDYLPSAFMRLSVAR